jgi:hypothetical protein
VSRGCSHQPKPGTWRTLQGGPADLLNSRDYPIVAECMYCGLAIRSETFLVASPPWIVVYRPPQ